MEKAKGKNNNLARLSTGAVILLGLAALGLSAPAAWSQVDPAAKGQASAASPDVGDFLKQNRDTGFVYQREGRPDPFFPFLTQQIMQAEAAAREELTGMRKFEPGQLALVAVVFTEKEPLAMVQDSSGIGYTLRKGTKIGRSGEVADIVPNKVIIRQQTYSLTKKKEYRTVEMVLKKEGDKKK